MFPILSSGSDFAGPEPETADTELQQAPGAKTLLAKGKPEPLPVGEPFKGFSALCKILDPGVHAEAKNTASLTAAVMLYRDVTDSPITTGWVIGSMNYDMNTKSGSGTGWGTMVRDPDSYTGTLIEDDTATAKRFVFDSSGAFIGTGDPSSVPGDMCGGGPIMDVQNYDGYIQMPE
jgi:hypothetical protein